jgi:protocatechuate 3,4-dioxygenase, beta subunit
MHSPRPESRALNTLASRLAHTPVPRLGSRRRFLGAGLHLSLAAAGVLGSAGLASVSAPALASSRRALAAMTDGPFYPPAAWRADWEDQDADLSRVQRGGRTLVARGEHLGLEGRVVDTAGRLIDGAEVEIWQCDALAHYRHPRVARVEGRFDPGFQGFGLGRSDSEGRVLFRTIRPVTYPGRTPHIHLKLRHASFGELTTQLFVAGDPGNARDFLWRRLRPEDQAPLAMQLQPADAGSGLRWTVRHALPVPA